MMANYFLKLGNLPSSIGLRILCLDVSYRRLCVQRLLCNVGIIRLWWLAIF